jgi:hypothetical protein
MTMSTQDAGVRDLRARLSTVLTFARVLAGHRGWAHITWHGQGFTYTLFAVRDPVADPASVHIDDDTTTGGLGDQDTEPIRARLREILEVHP